MGMNFCKKDLSFCEEGEAQSLQGAKHEVQNARSRCGLNDFSWVGATSPCPSDRRVL